MEIIVVLVLVIAAVAAVLVPLVRRSAGEPLESPESVPPDEAAIETEVARYRESLRAGSLCRRCGAANPPGSRYCAECGRPLTEAAA